MKYNYLTIFYFSGTGNAKNAAKWIVDTAKNQGITTRLVNIEKVSEEDLQSIPSKSLIGFCSPTHGFNLPPLVLKFIRKFPRNKGIDAFILNTRGGLKLSKLFLPGLSGVAQILPAFMLWAKGYRIVGMQPLDLPSNWLILHPGLKKTVIDSIYERCHGIVVNFANDLFNGKRKYKALLSLPLDLIVAPIALGYYFIGRFFLAKTLVATHDCTNCEKCIKQCPVQAIKMIGDRPFWTYKCESCMRCVNACPERAIETAHGFSTVLILISSFIISPLLVMGIKSLGLLGWFNQSFITKNIWSLIDFIVFLIFVIISYAILHLLMKFKFINTIITYTSLSTYRFWRRYRAPNGEF